TNPQSRRCKMPVVNRMPPTGFNGCISGRNRGCTPRLRLWKCRTSAGTRERIEPRFAGDLTRTDSPPGPELHPQVTNHTPGDQVNGALFAAVNFGVACHFRFEQSSGVVEPGGHQHGSFRLPVGLFGDDRRDSHDLSLEDGAWIGPRLEHDFIADLYVGN